MTTVVVHAEREDRYWYPDDGGAVWLAGYQLVDPESGRWLGRDAPELAARGLRVTHVAGAAQHHSGALQSDGLQPGSRVLLRRDPANPHDPNAISVETTGGEQAGWVPRDVAAELAADIDAGRPWSALVLRERRASPRDPRQGATLLLARGERIDLRA